MSETLVNSRVAYVDRIALFWSHFTKHVMVKKLADNNASVKNLDFLQTLVDARVYPSYDHTSMEDLYFNFFLVMYHEFKLVSRNHFAATYRSSESKDPWDSSTWAFSSDDWALTDKGIEVLSGRISLAALCEERFDKFTNLIAEYKNR